MCREGERDLSEQQGIVRRGEDMCARAIEIRGNGEGYPNAAGVMRFQAQKVK
jgi:hypothetical protein